VKAPANSRPIFGMGWLGLCGHASDRGALLGCAGCDRGFDPPNSFATGIVLPARRKFRKCEDRLDR
jgi:hypothetical protein